MSEWQEVRLGDVLDKIVGGGTPSKENPSYWDGGDIFWCSVKDMSDDKFRILQTKDTITLDGLNNSSANLIPKGTVITATRMGLGRAFINETDMAINQDLKALIPNSNINNKYLLWTIILYRNYIEMLGNGATVKGIRLETLKNIKINLPPLPAQQKIAKILSNYDDLIENNLKRIKLLEESARLTYEEWFLRFRIDGKKLEIDSDTKLPFGWKKVKVNSLVSYYIGGGWGEESISDDFSDKAYVIRGTDINDIPYGNLEGAPLRCHKASNLASRKLQNKDIIFEVSGGSKTEGVAKTLLMTDNLLEQFNNDVMCASFCKLVRPKEQCLGNLLHLSFKYLRNSKATEVFEIKSASSIINYNWEAFIKHQDLIMPSHDVLLNFDKKVDVLVNEIYNLGHQNQLLQEARDILLPRLMTNVIDTDELDIAV